MNDDAQDKFNKNKIIDLEDYKFKFNTLRQSLDTQLTRFRHNLDDTISSSWQSALWTNDVTRQPVPITRLQQVYPYGIKEEIRYPDRFFPLSKYKKDAKLLTLSGGGANGAYGAGVLAGWSQRGSRPEFDIVMGVSTGAVIGLFAFLGIPYDHTLKQFYTQIGINEIVSKRIIEGLVLNRSLFNTSKLNELIHYYIDDAAVRLLADANEKGRKLLIGTTNLDRSLPFTWDLTAIANTESEHARALIIDVILASCSIPLAFPPVLLPVVTKEAKQYDEMHVDGGATRQILTHLTEDACVYAIVNNFLSRPYRPISHSMSEIAEKSLSTLISHSVSADLQKLFIKTQQDSSQFLATWIPEEFDQTLSELFDQSYMQTLYQLGYDTGFRGNAWHDKPFAVS